MDAILIIVDSFLGNFRDGVQKTRKFLKHESGMMDARGMIGAIILTIVAVVVAAQFGSAILPSSITTIANTSGISGYSTWNSGTQNLWTTIPLFIVLTFLLIFVALILVIV